MDRCEDEVVGLGGVLGEAWALVAIVIFAGSMHRTEITHSAIVVLNPDGIFPPIYAELAGNGWNNGGWRDMAEAGTELQGRGLARGLGDAVGWQVFAWEDDWPS